MTWDVLTGEFPPGCGGVGDYTAQLADALAKAGHEVRVWVPAVQAGAPQSERVQLHSLGDVFGPASCRTLEQAWGSMPGTVLVQYVPNAFGRRGMNLTFCRWLRRRAAAGCDIRLMFHEPYLRFTVSRPWRNVAAAIQRLMARELLRASSRVYVSSASWVPFLEPYGAVAGAVAMPIPSTIPQAEPGEAAALRRSFAPRASAIVGHFGTYGEHVGRDLRGILPAFLTRCQRAVVLLVGGGSIEFRHRLQRDGMDVGRVHATGRMTAAEVAAAIAACDVVVQPYPDGVTTRRTSVMAALCNGTAVVTSDGYLTERVWRESGAVQLVPASDREAFAENVFRLLENDSDRDVLAQRGASLYARDFAMERTIAVLRGASTPVLS